MGEEKNGRGRKERWISDHNITEVAMSNWKTTA